MSNLVYTITLVLGDWSHDGHSISHNEYIKSNIPPEQVENAYEIGKKVIGVDLVENVAAEYEDGSLRFEDFKKFIDIGFLNFGFELNEDDLKNLEKEEDIEYMGTDLFVALYLFTVHIGNDKFKYEISEEVNSINIGGYGLFGS